MVTARALVLGNEKTLRIAGFGPGESPRSLQLYGTDPLSLGEATQRLVGEGRVDHLDLNFGCPVKKVTAKGGGAAIPLKPRLLARLVRAVVGGAGGVPVTMKFRKGVDEARPTYRDAGRVGEEEGCVAVGLHARTAAQLYDGEADWDAIGDLKALLRIPVLGNGDVWEGEDALRMMRHTRCDGVIVGRGCLGRPWLFRDLTDLFDGRAPENPPPLGEIVRVMLEHGRLLCDWIGEERGILMMRKFATWYTKAFPDGAALRERLTRVTSLGELAETAKGIDGSLPFPPAGMRAKRGKRGGTQKVSLPPGYAEAHDDDTPPCPAAEEAVSGG
jgi:nifR3 family TIM-barrel protein